MLQVLGSEGQSLRLRWDKKKLEICAGAGVQYLTSRVQLEFLVDSES